MHNVSLAVEDAVVFGVLFSHLRSHQQIPIFTEAYQDLRMSRCISVTESELSNAHLVQLPPGEARDQRDASMRASRASGHEHWDEGQLRKQWEEIASVFGYCARDAAEDWWVNWGVLRERSEAINPLEFKFEAVTEVVMTPSHKTEFTELAI
jgi:salicylate hydroxylase